MGEFKRSPSKFSWDNEFLESRSSCKSPGSQDSGFSDTETSSNLRGSRTKDKRLTPQKHKLTCARDSLENVRLTKSETKPKPNVVVENKCSTDPICKKTSTYPRIRKNLFTEKDVTNADKYSESVQEATNTSNSSQEAVDDCSSCSSDQPYKDDLTRKESAGNYDSNECCSGSDEELDFGLESAVANPKFTSTPKIQGPEMRSRQKKRPANLLMQYHYQRVPPIAVDPLEIDNEAVQLWIQEARQSYEQECMTTLQCKSIFAELNQKMCHLATCATKIIRTILHDAQIIEMEYQKLTGEIKHVESLVQSLTGNIMDFLKTYTKSINSNIVQLYDKIRLSKFEDSASILKDLYSCWLEIRHDIMVVEIEKIVSKLECPTSELDLRATITAISSLTMRNEEIIDIFIKCDVVPILIILCEKCEGSSSRTLILRTLSSICYNSLAVKQFEKYSGISLINEVVSNSRPEPEISEAVALLVQVTAPWLEDKESVKGLKECSCQLVASLTTFSKSTKCCQNLLLCTAALANLSSLDPNTVQHIIKFDSVASLIDMINLRGQRVSIYTLEQLATLIANMSSSDTARRYLIKIKAPTVLLYCLKKNVVISDAAKRLQQKSIIALSRLCFEKEAAAQVVELGGVEKLVKMCRERRERYDSDAVLVASLATLRKITDACGKDVLSSQDAQELVEPKLLDTFLTYSTQSESYV